MRIDTLTGDEFARLDADDHRTALALYETAVSSSLAQASHLEEADPARGPVLDRLTSQLTLRKLHRVRLAELEEESTHPSALA